MLEGLPLWVWAVGVVATGYFSFRLHRALTTKATKYGIFDYSREGSPVTYWGFTLFDTCALLAIVGSLVIVITHQSGH